MIDDFVKNINLLLRLHEARLLFFANLTQAAAREVPE